MSALTFTKSKDELARNWCCGEQTWCFSVDVGRGQVEASESLTELKIVDLAVTGL